MLALSRAHPFTPHRTCQPPRPPLLTSHALLSFCRRSYSLRPVSAVASVSLEELQEWDVVEFQRRTGSAEETCLGLVTQASY
jgi:hypothetical protein